MNRKIALALLLVSAGAYADDITMDPPFTSTASRAQVLQELQQFRQSGVNPWADEYNPVAGFRSARTREETTREYIQSRDVVGALNGEDSGSAFLARREPAQPAATQMAGDNDTSIAAAPAVDQ
jgi:hypothetical protein